MCVEPDPILFRRIAAARPRDVCLNVGIGLDSTQSADFYIMRERTLNTFSRSEADEYVAKGYAIEKTIQVPLLNVNELIAKYFKPCPNVVSIDVEGLDLEILKSFDFAKYRPEIFCVETASFTTGEKDTAMLQFMAERGYRVFADTYLNTIFVDAKQLATITSVAAV